MIPKRHHFIPQMMLRHFTDDDNQLWFWRREFAKGDVRKTAAKNLFVKKDLYARILPDGKKDVALEEFFARMEAHGAQFIAQIADAIRNNQRPKLDANAWEFWLLFFYYHIKRSPGAIEAIATRTNFDKEIRAAVDEIRAIRAVEGHHEDNAGLEGEIAHNARILAQAARPGPELQAYLNKMGLAIYRMSPPDKSFILGDVPDASAKFWIGNGWSQPTGFFPITPNIAVGLSTKWRQVDIINVDRDQARRMNVAIAARSRVIAGRSEALIASLSANVPYTGAIELKA